MMHALSASRGDCLTGHHHGKKYGRSLSEAVFKARDWAEKECDEMR